jgi:hypothetical protein
VTVRLPDVWSRFTLPLVRSRQRAVAGFSSDREGSFDDEHALHGPMTCCFWPLADARSATAAAAFGGNADIFVARKAKEGQCRSGYAWRWHGRHGLLSSPSTAIAKARDLFRAFFLVSRNTFFGLLRRRLFDRLGSAAVAATTSSVAYHGMCSDFNAR